MIKSLAHVCIFAKDLDETLRFYTEVLGLEKAFDFEKDGAPFGYYIKLGNNTFIEVFKGKPSEVGGIKHIAIETDNIEGLIAQIRAHGINVPDKRLGADQSWQFWIQDPNGIDIEFHEYTKDSKQIIGGTAIVNW